MKAEVLNEWVTLIQGDCLEAMGEMAAKSVDLVLTDPPYGQTNEGYDRGVPQGVWEQTRRVCKDDSALVSFAGSPTYHTIASGIEAAGWKVRQMWAWVYRDGFITSAWPRDGFDRLAPAMDPICFATQGKVILTLSREGRGDWTRERRAGDRSGYSERAGQNGAGSSTGHWPRSVVAECGLSPFDYFVLSRGTPAMKAEREDHPNQKPAALIRWLLDKVPGGLALDPYAGSGTLGVVAMAAGRRCVLVERNPEFCDVIRRRVERASGDGPGSLFNVSTPQPTLETS